MSDEPNTLDELVEAERTIEWLREENRLLRVALGQEMECSVHRDPCFNGRKFRGWYIAVGHGIYYLHRDSTVRNGIQSDELGFWPSEEEAKAFLRAWQRGEV